MGVEERRNGGEGKAWVPVETDRVQTTIPRAIALPPDLAVYTLEKPRTAYEMYVKVVDALNSDEAVLSEQDVGFIKQWFLAAGQQNAAGVSPVSVELEPAMVADENFAQCWRKKHLDGQVGAQICQQEQGVNSPAQNTQMAQSLDVMAKL